MPQVKAALLFDPDRRDRQRAFVAERTPILHSFGDQVWVAIAEEQAERFVEQGIQVQLYPDADQVELPALVFRPVDGEPAVPAELRALPAGADQTYHVVLFVAGREDAWVGAIEEMGGQFVEDLDVNTSIFRLNAEQAREAADAGFVAWLGPYHPGYALAYDLAGRDEPFDAAGIAGLATASVVTEADEGALRVTPFADHDAQELRPGVEAAGATVIGESGYDLIINLPPARLKDLLRTPGVRRVSRHRVATLANQRAGLIMTTNQVRNFGNVDFLINLDGTGEIVGVIDSGLDNGVVPTGAALPNAHADFCVAGGNTQSRVILLANLNNPANPNADLFPHGTHVVGSICSDGRSALAAPPPAPPAPAVAGGSIPRGIAPAAQIVFHSSHDPTIAAPFFNPTRFVTGFQAAYNAGARVHTNSWGASGPNAYTNTSGVIDRFAFLNPDMVILFAAHNNEADLNNDGRYDQNFLGPQAVAKNILTIGACENETTADGDNRSYLSAFVGAPCNRFGTGAANPVRIAATAGGASPISSSANDMAAFSCRGRVRNPANPARRRVKPDLVAPGTNILSTLPVGFALPANIGQACPPPLIAVANPQIGRSAPAASYFCISGTSMATPLVAGACALVRQFYRQRFGQLRNPVQIQQLSQFVDRPLVAGHPLGSVIAWVARDAGAGQNHIEAQVSSRTFSRVGTQHRLATNVGGHPAPQLHCDGAAVFLLYRDATDSIQLCRFDLALSPTATFGTNGVVTVAPKSRSEDDRRPALCATASEIAVAWFQKGRNNLRFQRFRLDTGAAIDSTAATLGVGDRGSAHSYLAHDGSRYTVVWARANGANQELCMRQVAANGAPVGDDQTALLSQAGAIEAPHLVWDARQSRYIAVWVDGAAVPDRGIRALRIAANGAAVGGPVMAVRRDTGATRDPMVALHPSSGFVLLWEDDRQGTHDLYAGFLDATGTPATVARVQVSDTPNATAGFDGHVDGNGVLPVWQSNDEVNSDQLGVYALTITPGGVFQARADPNTPLVQVDPRTPLLQEQHYVRQRLAEHGDPTLIGSAIAWGGGDVYFLHVAPGNVMPELHLVRTNADGRVLSDAAPMTWFDFRRTSLHWTGRQLVACSSFGVDTQLMLLDDTGQAVNAFASTGLQSIAETPTDDISVQASSLGSGAAFRIYLCYGQRGTPSPHNLRYTVFDGAGVTKLGPRTLVQASGTARHGWFHLVGSDAPVHMIAAWHFDNAGQMIVRLNRFRLNGTNQAGIATPIVLTGLAGNARNAVLAPRPITFAPGFPTSGADTLNSRRREYGAAWQHQVPGGNWQVLFSRLQRNGRPSTVAGQFDVVVVQSATDHCTDPQLVWHTDGYGLAWLQQPTGGGAHQLFFTVIDQNGQRPSIATLGLPAAPVANFAASAAAADVQEFQLIWTGRTFRLAWTEVEAGRLRQMQQALTVPRPASGARFDAPFQQPSSALVRATLVNGATNIANSALPNVGAGVNDGYGWGRVNLRQALAPAPPITFHVRDDGVVGPGRTVRYEFALPAGTRLLRITLAWTDPPGNAIVNHLHLRVTTPAFAPGGPRVFHGNTWQTAAGSTHLSRPVAAPVPTFEDTHTMQQVVIAPPPDLPEGTYIVEVIGGLFGASSFQQFPGQAFALVLVGSGPEFRTAPLPAAGPVAFY